MPQPDIRIKFNRIVLLSKSMSPIPQPTFNQEIFNFEINGQVLIKKDINTLLSVADIKIKTQPELDLIASISIGCEFQLENFDEVIDPPDANGVYTLPPHLDTLVKTMTISTARGVLFSEFRGTYLQNAILPIIFLAPASPDK